MIFFIALMVLAIALPFAWYAGESFAYGQYLTAACAAGLVLSCITLTAALLLAA